QFQCRLRERLDMGRNKNNLAKKERNASQEECQRADKTADALIHEAVGKLTEQERDKLLVLSQLTGRKESELIHEALEEYLARLKKEDRLSLMQKAKGMWKDRQDLPAPENLRHEWDRF